MRLLLGSGVVGRDHATKAAKGADQDFAASASLVHELEKAEIVAICAVFDQAGELSAPLEMRRRFPGVTDNVHARRCARSIAGWKPSPAAPCTTAQVCETLDRWPFHYNGGQLQAVSVGVGLAIATAMACMTAWAMFRGTLGILPLAPLASRFIAPAVGGALCGVGFATFSLLLSLHGLAADTLEEMAGKAFLSWKGTAPWAAAVLAVLFMLSAIPSVWRRWTSRAATR